jgi:hypothetical protein
MCLVIMTVMVTMIMVVVVVKKVVVVMMIMIIDYAEIKTKGGIVHLIHAAAASFMMRVAAPAPTV